jgi:hypothetical protein
VPCFTTGKETRNEQNPTDAAKQQNVSINNLLKHFIVSPPERI